VWPEMANIHAQARAAEEVRAPLLRRMRERNEMIEDNRRLILQFIHDLGTGTVKDRQKCCPDGNGHQENTWKP